MNSSSKKIHDICLHWERNAKRASVGHYRSAEFYSKLHIWLGVPVIILSVIVGSSVFMTLESDPSTTITVLMGVLSLFAASLSGLQTFLSFGDKAEQHKSAGSKYASIKRELELLSYEIELNDVDDIKNIEMTKNLMEKLSALGSEAPHGPSKIWQNIQKEIPPKDLEEYYPD